MSAPNPALVAAAPALIAALQAFTQFETDLGTDPAKIALNYPAAKLKFLGTLGLQIPVIASAEVGVAMNLIGQQAQAGIAKLQALQAAAPK